MEGVDGEVGVDVEVATAHRLMEAATLKGRVGEHALDAGELAHKGDELVGVERAEDGLQGRAPGLGVGVGELALVDVGVGLPLLAVGGGKLGDGIGEDVRVQEVLEGDVGEGRAGGIGRFECRELCVQGREIDHLVKVPSCCAVCHRTHLLRVLLGRSTLSILFLARAGLVDYSTGSSSKSS